MFGTAAFTSDSTITPAPCGTVKRATENFPANRDSR
jgi:hypothetical protein